MYPPQALARSKESLVALWERLVPTLGVHTVHVVLDRALWQAAQRYPTLALIHHDEAGLHFEALEQNYRLRPPEELEAVLDELVRELLCTLARVLGREVAWRLCADPARSASREPIRVVGLPRADALPHPPRPPEAFDLTRAFVDWLPGQGGYRGP